jgi:hypothetical protein
MNFKTNKKRLKLNVVIITYKKKVIIIHNLHDYLSLIGVELDREDHGSIPQQ